MVQKIFSKKSENFVEKAKVLWYNMSIRFLEKNYAGRKDLGLGFSEILWKPACAVLKISCLNSKGLGRKKGAFR